MLLSNKLDEKINSNNSSVSKISNPDKNYIKYLFFCELLNYKNLYKLTHDNGKYIIKLSNLINTPDKYSPAFILPPSQADSGDNKLNFIYVLLQKEI